MSTEKMELDRTDKMELDLLSKKGGPKSSARELQKAQLKTRMEAILREIGGEDSNDETGKFKSVAAPTREVSVFAYPDINSANFDDNDPRIRTLKNGDQIHINPDGVSIELFAANEEESDLGLLTRINVDAKKGIIIIDGQVTDPNGQQRKVELFFTLTGGQIT